LSFFVRPFRLLRESPNSIGVGFGVDDTARFFFFLLPDFQKDLVPPLSSSSSLEDSESESPSFGLEVVFVVCALYLVFVDIGALGSNDNILLWLGALEAADCDVLDRITRETDESDEEEELEEEVLESSSSSFFFLSAAVGFFRVLVIIVALIVVLIVALVFVVNPSSTSFLACLEISRILLACCKSPAMTLLELLQPGNTICRFCRPIAK
jgi:hypothetical protein